MKKWFLAIPVLAVGLAALSWVSERDERAMAAILNAVPSIDSIHVIDAATGKEIQSFTKQDANFSELVSVYQFPYEVAASSMDDLFDAQPIAYLKYQSGSQVRYEATLYGGTVEDEKRLAASNVEAAQADAATYSYSYIPEGSEVTYYLGQEELGHIFGVGAEHVKLIDSIVTP